MKIDPKDNAGILLLQVVKILNHLKIPYALIGAFATSFYGVVRASLDVDAVISIDQASQKLEQLFSALDQISLKYEYRKGDFLDPIKGVINVKDRTGNRVDLLTGIRRMPMGVFKESVTTTFKKQKIKIIGVEDLVAMKVYAGSHKDIQDVIGILQVSAKQIDRLALRKLIRQYGKRESERLNRLLAQYLPQ